MTRHDYLIIGAGPGGICAGVKLKESGREDFVILEKAGGVGGTWYHNHYPGAECDVPSHFYSFSFDIRADWAKPFATQAAILDYFEECAEKHGLMPHIRLDSAVASAAWDDDEALWRVTTQDGDVYEAPILLSAVGMFNELYYPEIAGLDSFAGATFHSACWREDVDLTGRRVGVIGSAASAVQFVPQIAKQVSRLDLYQRTANWVLSKADDPFSEEQLEQFRSQPDIVAAIRDEIFQTVEPVITFDSDELIREAEQDGLRNLSVVTDSEVRAKLTPAHPYGCKRPLLSNDYYPTFNRANVELISESIDHIEPKGIVTSDGRLREIDTMIFATGFETTRFLSAIDVTGGRGRKLDELWSDGAQAFFGMMVPGFPNLFMMYGPNTNNGSILHMIESQVAFTLRQIERIESEGLVSLDVRQDVCDEYNEAIQKDIDQVEVWNADCLGYYRSGTGRIVTQWPHNMTEYRKRTKAIDRDAFVATPRARA